MFTKVSLLSAYVSVHCDIIVILFASPKLISIQKSHLMTKIWIYLDTILSGKITHRTVNVVEPVFTMKVHSDLE